MLRPSLRPGRIACLALALAALLAGSEARAVSFDLSLDPALSQLDPANGSPEPLLGTIRLSLGSLPPLAGNTTFDLVDVAVTGGGFAIALDPDLSAPGLGVLRPDGSFLIPNLFLHLASDPTSFDQTLIDVQGTFGPCAGGFCVDSSFQVDSLGPAGLIDVRVVAVGEVPEPSPWLLLPLAGAAALRRRAEIAR